MGILDTAKAFARVGVTKAGRVAGNTAVKGAHLAGDAASKGAAKLNEAAGKLRDETAGSEDQPPRRPEDGGAPRSG
jgi:hypothetical protein